MPEIVINTGPVIALVAATGTLDWLAEIYHVVWVQESENRMEAYQEGKFQLSMALID